MLPFITFELATVFVVCSVLAYVVYNFKRKYEYWKDRNVPQVGFAMDYFANFWKHRLYNIRDIYEALAPFPYGGYYQGGVPYLMIRDPQLNRSIFIKDFSHFTDHGMVLDFENDKLQKFNIFNMTGQKWKNVRAKLTPIFSSGKLRRMSLLMNECTNLLDKYLGRVVDETNEIEIRDLFQKFTVNTIGICAFGVNGDAIENEDSDFKQMIGKMNGPKFFLRAIFFLLLSSILPKKVISYLKLKTMSPDVDDFFYTLVIETMKNREEAKLKRDDLLQLLINVRAEEQDMLQKENIDSEPLFDDDVCMANAFIFFAAGFEPVSIALSHCLYDLAINPEVTEKLHQEVKHVQDSHNGKIDYDVLKKMQYLDCVVSESLRLHPPGAWVERICTKAYKIPESSFVIQENTHLAVPLISLHLDPQYFPDPLKFDPDRFSEENKANIIPGTYFPFGDGPRICIAQRFALMEIKAAVALIVRKYIVEPSAKTQIPLRLNPLGFNNAPKTIHLKFSKRGNQ